MRLKGLHDIKTHNAIARNWSTKRQTRLKQKPTKPHPTSMASLNRELFLKDKTLLHHVEIIQDSLQEMRQAVAEGIPGAAREMERLTKRLKRIEAE